MANIGQFQVEETWTQISTITGASYLVGASYLIQNVGYPALMLCESPTQPEGNIGFRVNTGEKVLYTCKSGESLWVKSLANVAEFNIAEGE